MKRLLAALALILFIAGAEAVVVFEPSPAGSGTLRMSSRLEESADLSPGSWSESTLPFTISSGQKQVPITNLVSRRFFRLMNP